MFYLKLPSVHVVSELAERR